MQDKSDNLRLKRFITRIEEQEPKKIVNSVVIYSPRNETNDIPPLLITGGTEGVARAWNLLDGKIVREFISEIYSERFINAITTMAIYNPPEARNEDEPLLLTGFLRYILVWNIKSGQFVGKLDHSGEKSGVLCITIRNPLNGDEPPLAVSAGTQKKIMVWNLKTFAFLRYVNSTEHNHTDLINSMDIYFQPFYQDGLESMGSGRPSEVLIEDNSDVDNPLSRNLLELNRKKHHPTNEDIIHRPSHAGKMKRASIVHSEGKSENAIKVEGYFAMLVTASTDKNVIYWNLDTGEYLRTITCHSKMVTAVHIFSPTQGPNVNIQKPLNVCPVLITASMDKSVIVWDLVTGEKIRKLEGHTDKVTSIASVDTTDFCGPRIITCGNDKKALIFDLLTGELIRALEHGHSAGINSVASYSHPITNKLLVATGSSDGSTIIWNFSHNKRTKVIDTPAMVTSIAYFSNKYHGDRMPQLIVALVDNTCVLFDIETCNKRDAYYIDENGERIPRNNILKGHTDRVNSVCVYEPNDSSKIPIAITAAADKLVKVWNLLTGQLIQTLSGHTHVIFPMDIYIPNISLNNNHRVQVITGAIDKIAKVWELNEANSKPSFECKYDLVGHDGFVRAIAVHHPSFAGEDPIVVTGGYDNLIITWNLLSGTLIKKFKSNCNIFTLTTFRRINNNKVKSHNFFESSKSNTASTSYIISGGSDCKAKLWDMETGEKTLTLDRHSDTVTCVAVYNPSNGSPPLLVTGSIDKIISIWNLESLTRIDDLIGHKDRLMSTLVHVTPAGNPVLITGSDDKTVRIWEDTLYPFKMMPLTSVLEDIFDIDSTLDNWPYISQLAIEYGIGLFAESAELFNYAVRDRHTSFLAQFKTMLSFVLRFLPKSIVKVTTKKETKDEKKSLLFQAIENKDLESIRVILDCWLDILNTDMMDFLIQILFHPSYYFDTKGDLVRLAEQYPTDFNKFISSIKLVRMIDKNYENNIANKKSPTNGDESHSISSFFIDNDSRSLVTANNNPNIALAWMNDSKEIEQNADKQAQPVTTMYIPIENAMSILMLEVYIRIADELDDSSVFDTDLGIYAYRYVWECLVRDIHWIAIYKYLAFLVILTIACVTFGEGSKTKYYPFSIFLHLLILVAIAKYFHEEYTQMMMTAKARAKLELNNIAEQHQKYLEDPFKIGLIISHFSSFWNIVDMMVIFFATFGIIFRLKNGEDTPNSRCFLSTAIIISWFKVLYFMKPFEVSGPLVSMIIRILYDIRFFMLVLLSVVFGFSVAFWLLQYPNPMNFSQSILNSYWFLLGQDISFDFSLTVSPAFTMFVLVCFLSFIVILMLNALIALMGESFSNVRAVGSAQWRLDQASIILDQQFLLPAVTIPSYLYVLKYTSDLESNDNDPSDWKLKIKEQILQLKNLLNTQSKNYISEEEWLSNLIEQKMNERTLQLEEKINDKTKVLETKLDQVLQLLEQTMKK
eukprot:gene6741-9236_t